MWWGGGSGSLTSMCKDPVVGRTMQKGRPSWQVHREGSGWEARPERGWGQALLKALRSFECFKLEVA